MKFYKLFYILLLVNILNLKAQDKKEVFKITASYNQNKLKNLYNKFKIIELKNKISIDSYVKKDKLTGHSTSKNNLVVASSDDANIDSQGNLISVTISYFSSQGPTDDLRIKPDITGNGSGVFSTLESSDSSYGTFSDTSMASLNVAGTLMLLQEHYKNLKGNFMKAATLKGLALHTADDIGDVGPDAIFGWGLLNAKKAAIDITKENEYSFIRELKINQNETLTYKFYSDGTNALKASISWTDLPGNGTSLLNNTTAKLVNDLDIKISKDGVTFFPWRLTDVNTNDQGDNSKDPFERVDIKNASGKYIISITHKGNLVSGSQNFSLILDGILIDTKAPTTPLNLTASNVVDESLTLNWEASTDNVEVTSYDVYKNGVLLTNVTSNSANIQDLSANTNYQFYVKAKDAAENISEKSNLLSLITTKFFIYPNPSDTNLFFSSIKNLKKYEIFNLSGQKILESINIGKINVSKLEKGIYFIKITFKNNSKTIRKFIKN